MNEWMCARLLRVRDAFFNSVNVWLKDDWLGFCWINN